MAAGAVKAAVRCRLLSRPEAAPAIVARTARTARGRCPRQFPFDGAFGGEHSTEHIHNEIACPLVEGVMEGYNGTTLAYGQTGSGKPFTMQGVADPSSQKGIIPRAFEHIFKSVRCAENAKFLLRASYLEIYSEDVRDLPGADTKQKLDSMCRN